MDMIGFRFIRGGRLQEMTRGDMWGYILSKSSSSSPLKDLYHTGGMASLFTPAPLAAGLFPPASLSRSPAGCTAKTAPSRSLLVYQRL